MEWIKQFIISLIGVGCFIASWLFSCGIGGAFWTLSSPWYQLLLALAFVIVGAVIYNIKNSFNYVGLGFITGAIIGAFFPLYQGVEGWFENVRNFWPCFWVCVLYIFMLNIAGAVLVAGLKNFIISIFKLDGLTALISAACSIIGFYCALSLLVAAIDISGWMLWGMIFGLAGAYGGFKMPAMSVDDAVVYDGNGNMHFVASNISSDRVLTTDGEELRKYADGNYR